MGLGVLGWFGGVWGSRCNGEVGVSESAQGETSSDAEQVIFWVPFFLVQEGPDVSISVVLLPH